MWRRLQKSSLNPIASPPKPNNLEETPSGQIFFFKIPIIYSWPKFSFKLFFKFHSHQPSPKSFENKSYQFQSDPMHLGDTWHEKNGKNWELCLWHMVWFCHAVKVLAKSLELLLCSNKQMFLKFLTDQTNDCWNQVYCKHVLVFVFFRWIIALVPLHFFSSWISFLFPMHMTKFQNIPWSDCIITKFRCPIFLSIAFCDSTQ